MERILKELSESEIFTKVYLIHIYNTLLNCTTYVNTGNYSISFQSLFQDFYFMELLEKKWGKNIISDATISLLHIYFIRWKEYVENTSYGDTMFVFYDDKYHDLISEYLLPAIDSMKLDLTLHNACEIAVVENETLKIIDFNSFYNPGLRPQDHDVIWKIQMIYDVLLEKKLIQKPYMGED